MKMPEAKQEAKRVKFVQDNLLEWYDQNRRILPWRAVDGQNPDPYAVWMSEIMLQQTTVGAVKSYFKAFMARWPTVQDLAAANIDEVTSAWAGLGYYARARNLHKCAGVIANEHDGLFPQTQKELLALPGIGDYTSAAIMAIAFNTPAVVVDGNIERVVSRLFAVQDEMPKAKRHLKSLVAPFFEEFTSRPGDLAQAFMDLGSSVCIAKTPRCGGCPLSVVCQGYTDGNPETYPRKAKKKPKPKKHGLVYWITNDTGQVLLHRRPDKGLLGGMMGLPGSGWSDINLPVHPPNWIYDTRTTTAFITHVFTHFELSLALHTAKMDAVEQEGYFWAGVDTINPDDFPTVFKKALVIFLKNYSS